MDEKLDTFNAPRRSQEIYEWVYHQAEHYRSQKHMIIPMGDDFHYMNAYKYFLSLDNMINYWNEPFEDQTEYRAHWQNIIQSASLSVSTPSPITFVTGTDDGGSLTRTRWEVYYHSSPPGALPDEETDYMQLRASSAEFELQGTPSGYGGYFAITQEHGSQGMTGCDDEDFICLLQGVSGSPGALPWENQTLSLSVSRYGWASGELTSLSISAVPEPGTALLLGMGLAALSARKGKKRIH